MKIMKNTKAFTMIPVYNNDFYSKDERLNILHLYIVERVRGFERTEMTCYMSNEQFAQETNSSISTIKRAIKLLVELNILWAGYHQDSVRNKQRVLHIYKEGMSTKAEVQNEPHTIDDSTTENTEVQNDTHRGSKCTSERFKLTPSEVQNEPLVYKENIKEYHYKKTKDNASSVCTLNLTEEQLEDLEFGLIDIEDLIGDCCSSENIDLEW
jgi:hypothetical protein